MSEHVQLYIRGGWQARAETPEEIAGRFLRMIDAFKEIHPVFALWACNYRRPRDFETLRDRLAEEIAANATKDSWGRRMDRLGYSFGAYTRDTPDGRSFIVECHAGASSERPFPNDVTLATFGSRNPDPEILDYRIIRSALLAIVEAWEPVKVAAFSNQLFRLNRNATYFPKAWIHYLCPRLAQKIAPPETALVEVLPNGGLLMSAAAETFDTHNPKHLVAAAAMAATLAPLDRLFSPTAR
jgi:Immunity protein 52